ncbi:MAG: hypothetical protein QOJ59_568 [Thermomicrobiales bacterium]|nr:hypothetical protein [Thermomicrobiales bacterium]
MGTLPQDDARDDTDRDLGDEFLSFDEGLVGSNDAAIQAHVEARAALLNLVVTHPKVVELFDKWTATTRIGQLATGIAARLDEAAMLGGFSDRSALTRLLNGLESTFDEAGRRVVTVTIPDESNGQAFSAAIREIDRLIGELDVALDEWPEGSDDPVFADVNALVRNTWELPWAWLSVEIVLFWARLIEMRIGVEPYQRVFFVTRRDRKTLPSPPIEFHFQTAPGETIEDAYKRFRREANAVIGQFRDAAAPLPVGKRRAPDLIAQDVELWYRKKLLKKSKRSLAGNRWDEQGKQVRDAINRVDRWLALGSMRWDDDTP